MTPAQTSFKSFEESTGDDWAVISAQLDVTQSMVADRVLEQFRYLANDSGGFPVTRLEHSLQTATRAHRDGRDERYVVMALLHDIGDTLGTFNHPEIGAAMIRPFVSEEVHWIANMHGVFQGYYFFHYLGMDRDQREMYRGHPHFEACAEFCEKYDQSSFDPAYESAPLSFIEPMLGRVLARPINSIYAKVAE